MKPRGQLIVDEFAALKSVAGKAGLELPPELLQGRGLRTLLGKRDRLFQKLRLDPANEYHVALLCAIVHHHLYDSEKSAAVTRYGDTKDFNLLGRVVQFHTKAPAKRPSQLYHIFVLQDADAKAEYGQDKSINRFRMRLVRAAAKAIAGKMELTAKRQDRLNEMLPALKKIFAAKTRT
jgi:hypothetical protein